MIKPGPLLSFFDHAVAENFVRPAHRSLVLAETEPDRLLDLLAKTRPPVLEKWIYREEA